MFVLPPASAQPAVFESSDLPIILIDTGGETIPNEPKIPALMAVIDNGLGARNHVTDPPNDYDGHIGIEVRGNSSQMFPKKQYGMETRDADGENNNVELLGMPEENDWVLWAPYSDKSLMRNVLIYDLAREAGQYASRRRFVEVVLNGDYQGLYVLFEKVKRDDNRVDISNLNEDETSGDDLTGGYIIEINGVPSSTAYGWVSDYPTTSGNGVTAYTFDTPDSDVIVAEQATYIREWFEAFEAVMASPDRGDPDTGFPALIDLESFVDFVIWQELSRNVDGYRRSTFLYKDKDSDDPRLHAGPVWDFNIALGNSFYYGSSVEGFQYSYSITTPGSRVALWWEQMVESDVFQHAIRQRWTELRTGGILSDENLSARIAAVTAEVDEAQARNFERWPVLGEYVWPNAYIGETYADEVAYLEDYLYRRADWLDQQWPMPVATEDPVRPAAFSLSALRPNPVRGSASVTLRSDVEGVVRVDLVDRLGRRVATVFEGPVSAPRTLTVDTAALSAGVYVLRARSGTDTTTRRFTVLR